VPEPNQASDADTAPGAFLNGEHYLSNGVHGSRQAFFRRIGRISRDPEKISIEMKPNRHHEKKNKITISQCIHYISETVGRLF